MKNEKINEVLESIMSFNKDIEYNDTNPINNKNLYQSNLTVGNNNLKGETKINNLENKNKNDKSKNRVKIDKSEINLSEINIKIKGYIDGHGASVGCGVSLFLAYMKLQCLKTEVLFCAHNLYFLLLLFYFLLQRYGVLEISSKSLV